MLVASGCSHDFDFYDPRLAEPSEGGSSGTGGAGGTASGGEGGGTAGCEPGEVVSCYNGPPETEGVGDCVAGTTTCNDDGSGFGACENEVTPVDEICLGGDEDCDGEINEADALCQCVPGVLADCYEGPDGTRDVGICQGGSAICTADGAAFTDCVGQLLPLSEDCTTDVDDNCDGNTNDHCSDWAVMFGNDSSQWAADITIDNAGNLVFVGNLSGSADFGGGTVGSAGSSDLFVAKFDANGNYIWADAWGDILGDSARAVAIAPDDSIYVTGEFDGTLVMAGLPDLVSVGDQDLFIAKLASDGTPLWSIGTGSLGLQHGRGIAADATGVVIGGYFEGTLPIPGGPTLNSSDADDVFLIKLDPAGTYVWSDSYGAGGDDELRDLTLDSGGNVLITGFFDSSIDFGGGAFTAAESLDTFVAKLDPAGNHVWSHGFGGAGNQEGKSIAVRADDSVVLHGDFTDEIDLGGGVIYTGDSPEHSFVVSFDSTGAQQWSHAYVGPEDDDAESVAMDASGNTIVGITIQGAIDFGDGLMISGGSEDLALVKLDPAGDLLWSRRFGGSSSDTPNGIVTDASGNVYVAGSCSSGINFGGGALFGGDSPNICVARIQP